MACNLSSLKCATMKIKMKEKLIKCPIPYQHSLPKTMNNRKQKQLLMGRFGGLRPILIRLFSLICCTAYNISFKTE